MIRRLFALLELVGDRGAHVSAISDVLSISATSLDPVLTKLVRAERIERVSRGVFRIKRA